MLNKHSQMSYTAKGITLTRDHTIEKMSLLEIFLVFVKYVSVANSKVLRIVQAASREGHFRYFWSCSIFDKMFDL